MGKNSHLISRIAAVMAALAMVVSQAACDRKVNDLSRFETVTFGAYEQDGKLENGAEPLEWIVLEKNDTEMLLTTKYGIYAKEYFIASSKQDVEVSWAKCSLRRWLDNTIYTTCFSKDERAAIIAEDFKDEVTGKKLTDYVTIMTVDQVKQYLNGGKELRLEATDYAGAAKAYINLFTGAGWWWLRDMGTAESKVAYVTSGGRLNLKGHYADYSHGLVRLVVRVKTEAFK